jgi:septum formation protein
MFYLTHSPLILASASPRRLELLKQIGILPDDINVPDIDESVLKDETPQNCAVRLSQQKASKAKTDGHFVVAADTIVACGQRFLPKAETREQALDCLQLLSGRRHHVWGGVTIISPSGKTLSRSCLTRVQFKALSKQELSLYLDSEEWQGKAGGYAIQGLAASFIKSLQGSYSNVVGLSLYDTMQMLGSLGFQKTLRLDKDTQAD